MAYKYNFSLHARTFGVLGASFCLLAMLFALFLEHHLGLEPCKLCYLQRAVVVVLGIVFICLAIQNPGRWGVRLYALLSTTICLIGIATAARHIWLQNLPEDRVPACGPSINYMLETFSFLETLKTIWEGAGDCADVMWTFLGLTIPEQLLIYFMGMFLYSLLLLRSKN